MFDLEHRIALHAIQCIQAHLSARGMSQHFLELRPEPGVYS